MPKQKIYIKVVIICHIDTGKSILTLSARLLETKSIKINKFKNYLLFFFDGIQKLSLQC